VPLLDCEQYFSKFTDPFVKIILTNSIESKQMVEMFDKRASMLANPSRTREWATPEQADFDTVLAFFRTADEENRRKLEVGEVHQQKRTLRLIRRLAKRHISCV